MTNPLRDARDRVLAETNAQEVLKNLDALEDRRAKFRSRWVWELVQNARDAAPEEGVSITFERAGSTLLVRHDGRPFESDAIAHLVYHGSTKVEAEDEVGRFGTGFLSTHLLSRIVHVRGCLTDESHFAFTLDRSGTTVDAVREGMDRSWRDFEGSVSTQGNCQLTQFEYPLSKSADELVAAGLEDLGRCAPVVLAFSPEIRAITVEDGERGWRVSRGKREQLSGGVQLVSFTSGDSAERAPRVADDGTERGPLVAVVRDADVEAALPLTSGPDGIAVALPDDMARLFILFPLLDSDRLSLPTLVNSRRFKPREERDGVELTGSTPGPTRNKALLSAAVPSGLRLLRAIAENKWSNAQHALGFHSTLPDWVDKDWFAGLVAPMIEEVRTIPLMATVGGKRVAPQSSWIPYGEDDAACDALWTLSSAVRGSGAKLPPRDEVGVWSRNLANWARLRAEDVSQMPEALTVDVMARLVTTAATVGGLAAQLVESTEHFGWLRDLYSLIERSGRTELFDEAALLPTQGGRFRKRSEQLCLDGDISESLKGIGARLGVDVRDRLVDSRATTPEVEKLLGTRSEADVLAHIVSELKRRCQQHRVEADLVEPVAELIGWITERDRYHDQLEGLPVPTEQADENGTLVVSLRRDAPPEQRPLAPAPAWPEAARRHAGLFPKHRVIASALARHECWSRLAEAGYVHLSPVYEARHRIEAFLPDEPLPEVEPRKAHRAIQDVVVSGIAYLAEPDGGMLDTVRKSRNRAIALIRFLVEFVLGADERACETTELQCECGQAHRAFRGAWLVPLRRRVWVPLGTDGRRQAGASAESLAALLADSPDLVAQVTGERGTRLLEALGISSADLALRVVAKDEPSRVSLIRAIGELTQATGGDVERVRGLVDEIRDHPEVIKTIEDHRAQRQKVERNQSIGRHVEELLKAALESKGLVVTRTGVGSDFEVESDFTENGEELWFRLAGGGSSTLIEVKSARSDRVKMTPRQVETACTDSERFVLCVVPIDNPAPTLEEVRDRSIFVFGIHEQLQTVWKGFEAMREAAESAREPVGPIQLELVEGQARFCVGEDLWRKGLSLADAVPRFARQGEHERVSVARRDAEVAGPPSAP